MISKRALQYGLQVEPRLIRAPVGDLDMSLKYNTRPNMINYRQDHKVSFTLEAHGSTQLGDHATASQSHTAMDKMREELVRRLFENIYGDIERRLQAVMYRLTMDDTSAARELVELLLRDLNQ